MQERRDMYDRDRQKELEDLYSFYSIQNHTISTYFMRFGNETNHIRN